MRLLLIIFLLFWTSQVAVKGQHDAQFSQNMFNLLTINPGYAGMSDAVNLQAISRQQWVGTDGRPKTTVFGGDAPVSFFGQEIGVGLSFYNDQIGFLNDISFQTSFSYKIDLGEGRLGAGIKLGVVNQTLKPTWYVPTVNGQTDFFSGTDPGLIDKEGSGTLFDGGLGLFYQQKGWYAGISGLHLFNKGKEFDNGYFTYFRKTWYFTGGYDIKSKNKSYVWKPSILIKTDGASIQSDFNLNVLINKKYWGGMSYRIQDAIVLLGGIELKSGLKIGYSFDIPISVYGRNSSGSHELSIGYLFDLNFEKKSKRYKSVRYL